MNVFRFRIYDFRFQKYFFDKCRKFFLDVKKFFTIRKILIIFNLNKFLKPQT